MSYNSNENVSSMDGFTLDELRSWSKKQLREWLSKKGLATSGNKDMLSNRVYRCVSCIESDLSDTGSSDDEDPEDSKLPTIADLVDWEPLTSTNCPSIRDDDVQNYFLFEKNPVTGQIKNCKRQLKKARNSCDFDYFSNIMYNTVSPLSLFCAIKSNCSMRSAVKPQDGSTITVYTSTAIIAKQTAKIVQANCDCESGLSGVCSHVGGMLLRLVNIHSAWPFPSKPVVPFSPKRIRDMNFCSADKSIEKPNKNVYQARPSKDRATFLSNILKACPNSVLYQTISASSKCDN